MKTCNKNNMGMGFIPQAERVVDSLYQPGNVLIPLNSGDSLYMAAQKIRELGVDVYMDNLRKKLQKSDSEIDKSAKQTIYE